MKKIFRFLVKRKRWIFIISIGLILGLATPRVFEYFVVKFEYFVVKSEIGKSEEGLTKLKNTEREFMKSAGPAKYLRVKAGNYRSLRRYGKAVRLYRKIAEKYPEAAPSALLEIANTLKLANADDSELSKAYQEVIQKFPDSDEAAEAMSTLRLYQTSKDAQKKLYGGIIDQYPDNRIAAKALESLEKGYEDKPYLYQQLIKKYPDKYIAEVALGRILGNILETQSREDAQKVCLKILVEYPDDKIQIAAYKQLVAYALQGGNIQPVMDFSYSLIKDNPNTELAKTVTQTLADIQYQKGNYLESLRLNASLKKKEDGQGEGK